MKPRRPLASDARAGDAAELERGPSGPPPPRGPIVPIGTPNLARFAPPPRRAPFARTAPADQEDASSPRAAKFADRSPRRDRAPRERTAAGPAHGEAPRSPSPVDRAPRGDRPRRDAAQPRRDDDAPVIGLGDHVPDFLLRPVKARPRTTPEPVEAKECRLAASLRLERASRGRRSRWPGSVSIRL